GVASLRTAGADRLRPADRGTGGGGAACCAGGKPRRTGGPRRSCPGRARSPPHPRQWRGCGHRRGGLAACTARRGIACRGDGAHRLVCLVAAGRGRLSSAATGTRPQERGSAMLRFADAAAEAVPLHALAAETLEAWLETRDPAEREWLHTLDFRAKAGEAVVWPGPLGHPLDAVIGLGSESERRRERDRARRV